MTTVATMWTGTILTIGIVNTPDHITSLIIASHRKAPENKKVYSMEQRCPPGTPARLVAEQANLATLGKGPLDFTGSPDLSDADAKTDRVGPENIEEQDLELMYYILEVFRANGTL